MSPRRPSNKASRHTKVTPTPQTIRKPINTMTPDELRGWIATTRAALQEKQRRERSYLAHRARHGRYTPTDAALERDQVLASDLLWLLDEMEQSVLQ